MSPLLSFDPGAFSEAFGHSAMLVQHSLIDEPLLGLPAIVELAEELPATDEFFEHHVGAVEMLVPGGSEAAPRLSSSPAGLVRSIESNGCRMALRHIETVPRYRVLMNRVINDLVPMVPRRDGRLRKRESFLFLNSASSRVPVHADPEHNFLLQIRGTKTFRIGVFHDRARIVPEIERQYRGGTSYFTIPPDEFIDFHLEPGVAIYVPPEAPHMVDNGNDVSISLSVTFRTRVTERGVAAHQLNSRLRRLHLSPRPPGESAAVDTVKASVMRQAQRARRVVQRLRRA
jgi:hypothetical protein